MTHAPADLLTVRSTIAERTGLSPAALGIVGDSAHRGGYHCGSDRVVASDYSVVESPRDSRGLSAAASALDIGPFEILRHGRRITLRTLSGDLADRMRAGDRRLADVREIIYSPDGRTVVRVDRLGRRSSGDNSHLTHTHLSFFRDSEGRRAQSNNVLGVIVELLDGADMALDPQERALLENTAYRVEALYNHRDAALGAVEGERNRFKTALSELRKNDLDIDYSELAAALLDEIAARRDSSGMD